MLHKISRLQKKYQAQNDPKYPFSWKTAPFVVLRQLQTGCVSILHWAYDIFWKYILPDSLTQALVRPIQTLKP